MNFTDTYTSIVKEGSETPHHKTHKTEKHLKLNFYWKCNYDIMHHTNIFHNNNDSDWKIHWAYHLTPIQNITNINIKYNNATNQNIESLIKYKLLTLY